ncbi:hypothetical protein EDC96DRAFT_320859 [Choanephora cucurbitarum]|nr:hypothetical protein EDC96DRAFT_320859 [Choanephora cucurbitarum]
MIKKAKRSKKKEEDALSRVLAVVLSKLKNWKKDCRTEEVFIDQHLYPFLDYIFFQDKQYDYTRSYGIIPCSSSSNYKINNKGKMKATASSATKRSSRTIDTANPDFHIFCPFEGEDFSLLCIEVKKPGHAITQSLSGRPKLALEMKRSIDNQALLGVQSPKCYGLLVDGLVVTSFVAELTSHGLYTFLELEEFSLLRGKTDLGTLPDIVLSFCWLKNLVDEAVASTGKRRKIDSAFEKLLKPTVALPVQKNNCE